MPAESKLIPILRDGVDIIKMVLYKKLNDHLSRKYQDKEKAYLKMTCGAMINALFGIENLEEPFKSFAEENKAFIQNEIAGIALELDEIRIPLTDALRVQFLCDSLEGIDSAAILSRAEELNLLISDRQVPLPKNFMNLVRKLGEKFNILHQANPECRD